MNAKVKNTEEAQEKTGKSPIAWGMIGSVILAITTPFFYLNGKAYHDGYLGYFQLETSMFPMDTSTTFVNAVLAWYHAMTKGLKGGMEFIGQHWLWAVIVCALSILVFGGLNYLIALFNKKLTDKKQSAKQPQATVPAPSFFKEIGKCALYIFIPSYGLFVAMFFISFILMITITPFVLIGKDSAAEDLKNGFKDSPQVTVNDPDGHKGTYRIMQCSTSFCALYADGKAITVPIATLNWAISDVSKKLKVQQGN
jgi:hypothetical protein